MTESNPFRKADFASSRDWEKVLTFFLLDQLRMPDAPSWQQLAVDEETRVAAAFMAHQLANIALVRQISSEPQLRRIFPLLMGHDAGLEDLRAWFARRWIDQPRLHASLEHALKTGVSPTTHALTGS